MKVWMWEYMNTTTKLYESHLLPVCEKYDLTKAELDIILFLANNPQYDRAVDIIEVRKVAKSHVSVSVKSLLDHEYLKGIYEEDNKRDVHLRLMKKADPIVKAGREAQKQYEKVLMNGIGTEEINIMRTCIEKMMQNAENYYEVRK